jgi:FlaA1/EpsC-like NDP-sugar epimerase
MAARGIRSRGEHDMDPPGFVDDDPLKQGAVINGLKVLGSTEAVPTLVPALGIDQVIEDLLHREPDRQPRWTARH